MQTLAETTTTCAYSRAGGYGSTPVEGLLTREVIVHDAFTLVERLHQQHGVPGPYLLVGWSFGGSVILAEALAHPELTAGLVVLDNNFTVDYVKVCTASGRREPSAGRATTRTRKPSRSRRTSLTAFIPCPIFPSPR